MPAILVASARAQIRNDVYQTMSDSYQIDTARTFDECWLRFSQKRYEFTLMDLLFVQEELTEYSIDQYRRFLQPFWQRFPMAQIIVLTEPSRLREAVRVVKAGASSYLTIPLIPEELKYVIEATDESIRIQSELDYLRDQYWNNEDLAIVRTSSPLMRKLFEKVRAVAPTKTTVLLLGETGVGKGVIAKLIHRNSDRSASPFIHVHCGALPETLLESELFGHEKGAFTGAVRRKLGRFEIAKGGTIFLDEINTISASAQIKLLQILQDKVFQRVGGESMLEADVRVIAASNMDLKKLSDAGEFRSDLYYRLNVFPLEILPLRQRREDILLFARSFLNNLNTAYGKEICDLHPLAAQALEDYQWPGNIRELENVMERAYVLETSSILTPESFPQEMFQPNDFKPRVVLNPEFTLAEIRRINIEQIERQYLKELLNRNQGKINPSAGMAGITTRQLSKLLKKYEIRKEEFKKNNRFTPLQRKAES
ncbi:MAG: sigma-54-dependent Fis family transcriptional regulator [SAR324 cluster bacterium]|nr:sigma-54-dependent Fis family transcriptional regulator [SAR324 cluster bacterium]